MSRSGFSGRALAGTVALALTTVACDDLVADQNFQRWCGDALCDWALDEGSYEKVGTWHPEEYGVSFTSDPTAIHQDQPFGAAGVDCMRFEVVSDVGTDAELRLTLDFDMDGSVELERVLERASWESVVFTVRPPVGAQSFRIGIVKYGAGEAVMARMGVRSVPVEEGCAGPPLVSLGPAPGLDGGMP